MSKAWGEVVELSRWFQNGLGVQDVVKDLRELADWLESLNAAGVPVDAVKDGMIEVCTRDRALAMRMGLDELLPPGATLDDLR